MTSRTELIVIAAVVFAASVAYDTADRIWWRTSQTPPCTTAYQPTPVPGLMFPVPLP